MVSLFLGSESDSGSSRSTWLNQLTAPGARAGARSLGRWILIVRPAFAFSSANSIYSQPLDQNPTAAKSSPSSHSLARVRAAPWAEQVVGSAAPCPLRVMANGSLHLMLVSAPPPCVLFSTAPIALGAPMAGWTRGGCCRCPLCFSAT